MLANVSFGILVFSPAGWMLMGVVILIETLLVSRIVQGGWFSARVARAVLIANCISGILGIFISLGMQGGRWVVCWVPWMLGSEIGGDRATYVMVMSLAFPASVVIEFMAAHAVLADPPSKRLAWAMLVANFVSSAGLLALFLIPG